MIIKNSSTKYNSGVTLVELMVTVAIVGVFAYIALPGFAKMIENNRVSSATNELVSSLLLARSEALKRSNTVTLCPSSNQQTCTNSRDFSTGWIIFLDCDDDIVPEETITDCGPNGTEDIIKVGDGFDSLYMQNTSANKISFSYSGRAASRTNSAFHIGKDASNKKKTVKLNTVGRVRTEPYEVPDP